MKRKLLIVGHGRHGKDTVAKRLGLAWQSSSWAAGREAVWPVVRDQYENYQACFDDRHRKRGLWFRLISEYNREDAARLATAIYSQARVYVGLRSRRELDAIKAKFDPFIVYVDAHMREPLESPDSMELTADDADYYFDNNGDLDEMGRQIGRLSNELMHRHGYTLQDFAPPTDGGTISSGVILD